MSGTTTPTTPSNAGITFNEAGERIIPSSVRPDGTLRKEIKVRPGYRPPEDVEIYRNRAAHSWKQRANDGKIPGAEPVVDSSSTPNPVSSNAKKNAKKREAAKKKKAAEPEVKKEEIKEEATPSVTAKTLKPDEMTEEEKEKAAKALRKKLRQAQDLKDKKEKGEALLPEQLEKVIKVNELMRQLKALGLGD